MRKTDPVKQQERRRHILEAAAHCFAEHGFHATSTAQICERAAMSPGNLFHYYASKADIIEALVASDTDDIRSRMQVASAAPDARRALREWVDGQLALYQDPAFVRLGMEVLAEAVRNPRVHTLVMANEGERKTGLLTLLEAVWMGQAAPQPLAAMADVLLLLLDGVFSRSVVDPAFGARAAADLLAEAVERSLPPAAAEGHRGPRRPQAGRGQA